MRRASLNSALALLAAAAAGCGGGDGEMAPSEDRGREASEAPAAAGLTAGEFLPKLLPEKTAALEAVVPTVPDCRGVKVEPSFVLLVSDAAAGAEPDTPLSELVEAEC